jgi:hypothetical protein
VDYGRRCDTQAAADWRDNFPHCIITLSHDPQVVNANTVLACEKEKKKKKKKKHKGQKTGRKTKGRINKNRKEKRKKGADTCWLS